MKTSTDLMDMPGGSEYLPEGIQFSKFVELVYKKYCCDVILMRISKDMIFEDIITDYQFDMILDAHGDKCYSGYNNKHNDQPVVFTIDRDRTDGRIEDIFRQDAQII